MGCEQGSADETRRSGARCVADDPRESVTDVVERPQQQSAPTDQGRPAGYSGRCDEHQPLGALWLLGCELGRDQPTERMTDEVDASESCRVEPAAEPACESGGGKPSPESWQVDQMYSAPLCQPPEHRLPPAPGAGQPVHEDERLAGAGHAILDRRPVDDELPNLHVGQFGSRVSTIASSTARPGRSS